MEDFRKTYFNNLRRLIGLAGLSLPIILLAYTLPTADCNTVLKSISAYFHSKAGHIFSAFSLLIGVLLWNTVKYSEDRWLYRVAAVLSIIIGFVPNKSKPAELGDCIIRINESALLNTIHFSAAISFFILLSYLVYCRFTKTDKEEIGVIKQKRNRIYKCCGIIMIAMMIMIFIYIKVEPNGWYKFRPIFVGETIMLFTFSYAWFVKGQFWIKDKVNEE